MPYKFPLSPKLNRCRAITDRAEVRSSKETQAMPGNSLRARDTHKSQLERKRETHWKYLPYLTVCWFTVYNPNCTQEKINPVKSAEEHHCDNKDTPGVTGTHHHHLQTHPSTLGCVWSVLLRWGNCARAQTTEESEIPKLPPAMPPLLVSTPYNSLFTSVSTCCRFFSLQDYCCICCFPQFLQ